MFHMLVTRTVAVANQVGQRVLRQLCGFEIRDPVHHSPRHPSYRAELGCLRWAARLSVCLRSAPLDDEATPFFFCLNLRRCKETHAALAVVSVHSAFSNLLYYGHSILSLGVTPEREREQSYQLLHNTNTVAGNHDTIGPGKSK